MWEHESPNAERFFACIAGHDERPIGEIEDKLSAEGYWPSPWRVARRRAHIRWMMRTPANAEGSSSFVVVSDSQPSGLPTSAEKTAELLALIDSPEWQTLEEVRQRLVQAAWFPPGMSVREQIVALEQLLGTEEVADTPMKGRILCILDPKAVDPEPVYKQTGAFWTNEDTRRALEHFQMGIAEQADRVRRLHSKGPWGTQQ